MRVKSVLAVLAVIAVGMFAIPATSSATSINGVLHKAENAQKRANAAVKRARNLKIELNVRLAGIDSKVQGILDGVPGVIDALTKLKDGLTALSDGVQGPGIKGQLSAAGSAAPGAANAATPSDLPTGTLYRQIVLSVGGAFGPGAPIGARTWVKMPDVAALGYSNKYACTSAGLTDTAAGAGYAAITC